jgi:hypothetical protein
MSEGSKLNRILISLVIILMAPVILVLAFVQDFGNIMINERLVFVSMVTAITGTGLLIFSIFSRR